MKKTLLIAAAALAASVISSQAQVYSQNIVGYVNKPAKVGYNNVAAVFDSGINSLTNIITPGPTWNYTLAFVWNGAGFQTYTIDSDFPTGVADPTDSFGVPSPTIGPGKAFFFFNNTGVSNTLTLVGTVHIDGAAVSPETIGRTTNTLTSSPISQFIGSVLPVGGGLGSALQLTNAGTAINYTLVQTPVISAGGTITGFSTVTVDSDFPTGFADATDSFGVAEPQIPVASGFFFVNNTGTPQKWVQKL